MAKQTCVRRARDIFLLLFIRAVYLREIAVFYVYLISLTGNFLYLLVSIGLIIITVDTIYIVCYRFGKEYSW